MAPDIRGVRVDPVTGFRAEAGPFGAAPVLRFGAGSVGPGPVLGGLVVCPPLHAEHLRNYRKEFLLAEALAARGVAVQRFHYRSEGNSDGDPAELRFASMVRDALAAAAELRRTVGDAPLAFLGTRFGALVAAAAAQAGGPLVLWEPVVDGEPYLREVFRAQLVHDLRRGRPNSRQAMVDEVHRRGMTDVLGYPICRRFYDDAIGRRLLDEIGTEPRPVLVVQIGTAAELRPPLRALIEELERRGFEVETAVSMDEHPWWFTSDQWEPEEDRPAVAALLSHTAAWARSRLAAVRQRSGPATGTGARSPGPAIHACGGPSGLEAGDADAGSVREVGVFVPAGPEHLFGMLTLPQRTPRDVALLLLPGAGYVPSANHNGSWRRLARRAAALGYHVLRLDLHGVGESTGKFARVRMERPPAEDARAAVRWLLPRASRVLVAGSCFGARAALEIGAGTPGIAAMALLAMPFDPGEGPEARPVTDQLSKVAAKGIPLLLAWGDQDDDRDEALELAGRALRAAGPAARGSRIERVAGRIRGMPSLGVQEAVLDLLTRWLSASPSTTAAPPTPAEDAGSPSPGYTARALD